jgi:hypothetical protein
MSYPGYWGKGEQVTFGYRDKPEPSGGPQSPPLQTNSWDRPLRLYFCGTYWHGEGTTDSGKKLHGSGKQCKPPKPTAYEADAAG